MGQALLDNKFRKNPFAVLVFLISLGIGFGLLARQLTVLSSALVHWQFVACLGWLFISTSPEKDLKRSKNDHFIRNAIWREAMTEQALAYLSGSKEMVYSYYRLPILKNTTERNLMFYGLATAFSVFMLIGDLIQGEKDIRFFLWVAL
jgi:hypothetical protein